MKLHDKDIGVHIELLSTNPAFQFAMKDYNVYCETGLHEYLLDTMFWLGVATNSVYKCAHPLNLFCEIRNEERWKWTIR